MTAAPALVFDPSIPALSARDPAALAVLAAWRDGAVRLGMSEHALRAHLTVLGAIGADERLLRRWTTWLTHQSRVRWEPGGDAAGPAEREFVRLARAAAGGDLVTACPDRYAGQDLAGIRLLRPAQWLALHGRPV